jgi:hypothetical protein
MLILAEAQGGKIENQNLERDLPLTLGDAVRTALGMEQYSAQSLASRRHREYPQHLIERSRGPLHGDAAATVGPSRKTPSPANVLRHLHGSRVRPT